jgi:hypothetical protein
MSRTALPVAKKPVPIAVPSNKNRIRQNDPYTSHPAPGPSKTTPTVIPSNHGTARSPVEKNYEDFDMRVADNTAEYGLSTEDSEKALRDLMSDVGNSITYDIDMAEAIVPGFKDEVVLLPHQIIGRKWMAERESGKRTGGMLADDMGYV